VEDNRTNRRRVPGFYSVLLGAQRGEDRTPNIVHRARIAPESRREGDQEGQSTARSAVTQSEMGWLIRFTVSGPRCIWQSGSAAERLNCRTV